MFGVVGEDRPAGRFCLPVDVCAETAFPKMQNSTQRLLIQAARHAQRTPCHHHPEEEGHLPVPKDGRERRER